MDSFTQRMLEKAEQRSRALGLCNASAIPFPQSSVTSSSGDCGGAGDASAKYTITAAPPAVASAEYSQQPLQKQGQLPTRPKSGSAPMHKLEVVEKTVDATDYVSSQNKVLRQFSAVDKENRDLDIAISIVTQKNVEVEVQVEEQDITDDDSEESDGPQGSSARAREQGEQPLAKIRDTSRNRLQRLGALYSDKVDLSSPIHRTEGHFHAGGNSEGPNDGSPRKPKQRLGKLAALADTINQWEDDTSHHDFHQQKSAVPPPKPALPSRHLATASGGGGAAAASREPLHSHKKAQAPQPPSNGQTKDNDKGTKQLQWDPKVINSLEAQGFQRRESSTVKLAYDYNKESAPAKPSENEEPRKEGEKDARPKVGKLASSFVPVEESKPAEKPKPPTVAKGLVSGRAAVFESKASSASGQAGQKPQKDPTELSLKERMQLFEKNKGTAILPKAAFGMAPSITQIRQDSQDAVKKVAHPLTSDTKLTNANHGSSDSKVGKVRDKVAAMLAGGSTMSENQIKADISKQRQEDMQVLASRFNKQKNVFGGEQQDVPPAAHQPAPAKRPPPPPPPPQQPAVEVKPPQVASVKRRSPGDAIDEEHKRAKHALHATVNPALRNRLYPALSDLESQSDTEQGATTATATDDDDDDEEMTANDSYMESECNEDDSSAGICNNSLGREIMQVVQKNEQQPQRSTKGGKPIKEVRYADKDSYYEAGSYNRQADSSLNSSEASMGVEDYLDEALEEDNVEDGDDDFTQGSDDDNNADGEEAVYTPRERKCTTSSNSFLFRKTPRPLNNFQTISEEMADGSMATSSAPSQTITTSATTSGSYGKPVKSELSVNHEDENMVTLVHTVSFYRRQQNANSANSTPVRKICREQQVTRSAVEGAASAVLHFESDNQQQHHQNGGGGSYSDDLASEHSQTTDNDESGSDEDGQANEAALVEDKLKKLLDEVCKQQQVIAQTSQALNLCAATVEFSGSAESVEGERHLLVATHRRQACLDEVQRLRVEKSIRPLGAPKEKGRLTVKEITVPLRQNYIRKLASDTISGHHLVCLLKYNEHVLATKTVPTLPGLLAVKFPDVLQLNNVHADFKVTLEIYGMTAQREVLPHEVKYHINLNKKCGIKTPKKKNSDHNRLVVPLVQSPAGPNVVRTPALVQYGYAIFSLREIQRTTWSLTQVLDISPLEGVVHMKVNCELSVSVEYKGFLTMFEDISGFGAWHRRWCYLNGTVMNFWKYPDDEKRKAPMGSIDLYTCCSQKVSTVPRDICARLNTILLECQRPAKEGDEPSLIIVPNGRTTIVRHLLSADTKEEREEWCAYFNKALTLLRAWGPPQ